MKQTVQPSQLLRKSQAVWGQVGRLEIGIVGQLDLSGDVIELTTDDFLSRLPVFAQLAGVDPGRIAAILVGKDHVRSHAYAGYALRLMFELNGHYVEYPYSLTLYRVPKKVLITLGAIFIGIVTGVSTAHLHPLISGSVGGLGALFINILSQHYCSRKEPKYTVMEQFLLVVLSQRGEATIRQLSGVTKLHQSEITPHVRSLVTKGRVVKLHHKNGGVRYRVNPEVEGS